MDRRTEHIARMETKTFRNIHRIGAVENQAPNSQTIADRKRCVSGIHAH